MLKTPDYKYPQKGGFVEDSASAERGGFKAASQNCGIGGGADIFRGIPGAGAAIGSGRHGRNAGHLTRDGGNGIRYCRLVTDTFDDYGRPLRCYSVLAFKLEDHVVVDSAFIYDVTRSRLRFERLIRVARREQLEPLQLRYLVEDMLGAGLL